MSSASSPVRETIAGFVAGRVRAERLVTVVAGAYYRETGSGKRDTLRPLIEVMERAAPGVVELAGTEGGPGFVVQQVERPFPEQYEAELRRAAQAVLSGAWPEEPGQGTRDRGQTGRGSGVLARILTAVRRVFGWESR